MRQNPTYCSIRGTVTGAALRVVDVTPTRRCGRASTGDRPGRPDDRPSPHRVRIIDGTLACLARHGTAKTTVDDIARQAGVSRATVYRVFPGGRDEILAAVVDTEMARLFSALGVRLGEAADLAEALVGGHRRGLDPDRATTPPWPTWSSTSPRSSSATWPSTSPTAC